ncbi:MAG: type II CRISPR RNA-guided endonuclease Cas9 [Phycisphaerae bacterium]|nr:type II CRISPR RNA-guided endonuclease Cas9 [Phycisphaerae bacterium]
MNSCTLGLDIGTRSIGWALLKTGKQPSIVGIGVRVFPEGVDRDTKGLEKSKNTTRREARGSRRIKYRRNQRRDKLVKILQSAGLFPNDKEILNDLFQKDPYKLRAAGLDDKLELYEFGRVLFHINQRRGFKSNRKTDKSKEDGLIAMAVGELQKKIKKEKCRTLGEYFAKIDPEEIRIRDHYTYRSMYEEEFDKLWNKQTEFYPKVLTEDLRKKIRDKIIFFQRPLKPTDDLIGNCELETGEKRCPRGDWYARRFRLLQDVNNLKICNPDGSIKTLTKEQRKVLLDELSKIKEIKFTSIRKKMGLLETQKFNAEYEVNEKGKKNEKIKGDIFNVMMQNKKIFGPKAWDSKDEEEKIKLNNWLVELDDDELAEKFKNEYELTKDKIDNIRMITLPQRYMSFSRMAIKKLLPLMEEGKRTDEALIAVYPERNKEIEITEGNELPLPKDLRNPIVNHALFEIRKVVNAIMREYGKPKKIKIEMARDVRGSARERREIHFKMLENEKHNKETRKRLIEDMNVRNPRRNDIIKYNLWDECAHTCPYTGKHISQTDLFGENPEFQIEHILPYSRSLDDSFMNKTLCCVKENRLKGNTTPYEYYSGDNEKFEQIMQRLNKTAMPYWKKKKFWQKEINTDKIIERELNDTRYICREVVKYLKQICKDVTGTRGKVTSELVYQWGFIKDRDDHRQHAIDAAVVGITSNMHLRQLGESKYSKEVIFDPPWPHFREELAEKVKHIDVSHRVRRKVSGALHEETAYGPTDQQDEKGQNLFVYRKRLEDLTGPMVAKIVDPVVRHIVRERLEKHNINPDKDKKIPKEVWSEPLYMKTTKSKKKVPIKKVRIQDVFNNMIMLEDKNGKPYRAVAPGNNHHIEIFEYKDKKGQNKRDGKVVTMYEAIQRSQRGEAVVCKDYQDGKKFICSLAINEMFMLESDIALENLFRVQKISQNGQVFLRFHTFSGDLKKEKAVSKVPNKLKGRKVTVDMLGRIHSAND